MPTIEFLTTCITRDRGEFVTGDVLTCSDAEADHYVDACQAAKRIGPNSDSDTHVEVADPTAAADKPQPIRQRRRRADAAVD